MLANYLAAALRNMVRNKLYAAINIVGLTVGFTAALLIAVFVRFELSFDEWVPGHEDVYRVSAHRLQPTEAHEELIDMDIADWMKLEFPQIAAASRLTGMVVRVRQGEIEAPEVLFSVDPDFFR
jgi:putative ABC transport system permease protein